MGRRTDRQESYQVETWQDYEILVDRQGMFFVKDDNNNRILEGKTLDGLKAALRKAETERVTIRAILLDEYRDDRVGEIQVYGLSRATGSILYVDSHGRKQKASRWDKIYAYDTDKLAERLRLLTAKKAAEDALEILMESWPRITAEKKEDPT